MKTNVITIRAFSLHLQKRMLFLPSTDFTKQSLVYMYLLYNKLKTFTTKNIKLQKTKKEPNKFFFVLYARLNFI